jgi:type 1 glutamine amidotransferase
VRVVVVSAILLAVVAAAAGPPLSASLSTDPKPRILVFTKTSGFRHASIPTALRAVRELGAREGLTVDATENAAAFTRSNLARYRAVVFLMTTGDILDAGQQAAFERYIRAGGGFAGVHSAADTEYGWAWYGRLLGTHFRSHPQVQPATVRVERRNDPSTAGLPGIWRRTDEWYNFLRNPRRSVRVLATLDESSYAPGDGAMGRDHPIAWSHEFQGGRAWFTGGGHADEAYAEPLFRRHLIGGIRYAAGLSPPRIASVTARVRAGRVHVTVRYSSCRPCRGVLAIGSARTPVRLAGGRGTATSGMVAPGRRTLTVTLTDPRTALTDSVRRAVRVR